MKKVLFISNSKYISPASPEGGVKLCTHEYIELIETKFNIVLFPIESDKSFFFRLKKKLRIDAYEDYNIIKYTHNLKKIISAHEINYVFLNLSNTIAFSPVIKELYPSIKIILCSHGNESGDFLHEIVLHKQFEGVRKFAARYVLGKMLTTESACREYIDVVLTVSDVELNIEKWLGAKKIYMVPRMLHGNVVKHMPVLGTVGFFGDLSHAPNFYGIKKLCEAVIKLNLSGIELRLVSSQLKEGTSLEKEFPFITYLGYLPDEELLEEVKSWTFCLNPVFYYSRGVSTKLGKALGMGVPVITTKKGMRGYQWKSGEILSCDTPEEMAILISKHATNVEDSIFYRNEILKMKASTPTLIETMNEVFKLLESE